MRFHIERLMASVFVYRYCTVILFQFLNVIKLKGDKILWQKKKKVKKN